MFQKETFRALSAAATYNPGQAAEKALRLYKEKIAWLRDPVRVARDPDSIPVNQGSARAAAVFLDESIALTYPDLRYLA